MAAGFAWQTGYGAFAVSESLVPRVVRYIDDQQRHHQTETFEEEFIKLLQLHNIPYDPRYLWD